MLMKKHAGFAMTCSKSNVGLLQQVHAAAKQATERGERKTWSGINVFDEFSVLNVPQANLTVNAARCCHCSLLVDVDRNNSDLVRFDSMPKLQLLVRPRQAATRCTTPITLHLTFTPLTSNIAQHCINSYTDPKKCTTL